ncbi:olfactory receptor 1C1-like [Rhinatrema bivittatum]|uniref:olfactory receptor 1C1-like n=1 Tax=Rhinatrema bivittatum TaxID=194408 RepID=UPI00112C3FA6|nr:olfactory receptor 1C1-like [Rhinatrema bivittatum]
MEQGNWTAVTEFLLLSLSDNAEIRSFLFVMFLVMYLMNLLGNGIMISLIGGNPQLHTPMYFFLGNLSFMDMCFTSVTVPKMLTNLLSGKKTISFRGCLSQLYFFIVFLGAECMILSIMAYDRFIAICDPLHYTTIMNRGACLGMAAVSWIVSSLNALLHSLLISHLTFCHSNMIHHFFCDLTPLLKLPCTDTSVNELVIFAEGSLLVMVPFLIILISYTRIIATILKLQSTGGRCKAFSTCSSHLIVVALFYGTLMFMYLRPPSSYSLEKDRIASVVYNVLSPMLNPFIYSLRNKDVKRALSRSMGRKAPVFSW